MQTASGKSQMTAKSQIFESSTISVLLVEDNEHDRMAFERSMNKAGTTFSVSVCEKAEKALDKLADGKNVYDLVVVDYDLPGMNGLDFFRRLQHMNNIPPVVMMTGAGSENLAVEALQAGMYDYIIKDPAQGYLKLLPLKLADVRKREMEHKTRRKAQADLRKVHDELEKRVAARTEELLQSQMRLRRLSRKILESQENERKILAREIHDSISGDLAAIKICLEDKLYRKKKNLPNDNVSLEKLITIINNTIQETRRISARLRPSMLDDLGLVSTINWYCRKFRNYYPQIHVKKLLEIEEKEVPDQLKVVIYRILQEAMHNVARHSDADRVRISLKRSGNELALSVEDNGCGLEVERICINPDSMGGYGMANMRERAETCGGRLEVASEPGAGTAVHLTLPIG
jgi:signal transduction histidine kinase